MLTKRSPYSWSHINPGAFGDKMVSLVLDKKREVLVYKMRVNHVSPRVTTALQTVDLYQEPDFQLKLPNMYLDTAMNQSNPSYKVQSPNQKPTKTIKSTSTDNRVDMDDVITWDPISNNINAGVTDEQCGEGCEVIVDKEGKHEPEPSQQAQSCQQQQQQCHQSKEKEKEKRSEVKEMCRVCGDFASGVHFGVFSCEGCKVRSSLFYLNTHT